MMMIYYAHSGKEKDLTDGQLLSAHLRAVAELARQFAQATCPQDAALAEATYAAGWLHDLGKYRQEFQERLRGASPPRETTFHKQAGAAKARPHVPVAFAIAGHHGGLPNRAELNDMVKGDAGLPVANAVWKIASAQCPELAGLALHMPKFANGLHGDLFTRLVFSCLVDADWTDTAEHERRIHGTAADPPAPALNAVGWLERLCAAIAARAGTCRRPEMARVRDDVLQACLAAAVQPPGLFQLTVPTGGGKTLSGLAFALKHAAAHRLRRVIYVAPYLSILDQNARVIREALGFPPGAAEVLEHHSLAEPPGDEGRDETARAAAARRAENWDVPLVITTNVQFYESLFANRPGRCRKVHNIAGSVVLLDECQTLPPGLVAPTCAMLRQLADHLGCSVVLCTATQPAFDHIDLGEAGLKDARPIVPDRLDLFARLRRVRIEWPLAGETRDWPTVAGTMRSGPAALCVVNTRRAARELFLELGKEGAEGVFHLSTSMCPQHRLNVLDVVKKRLAKGELCYLVSTQLIEAGVDVDFPLVLRELAPLEAIIQAAGRCNREGGLNHADGTPGGRVVVFRSAAAATDPKTYYPPDRWYLAGRAVLDTYFLKCGREPQVDSPADVRDYFTRLYRTGELDEAGIQALRSRFDFRAVADGYRLIDDDSEAVVVATWEEKQGEVDELLQVLRQKPKPSRADYRALAPYQVNLRRYELLKLTGYVIEEGGVQVWRGSYDPALGISSASADVLLLV